MGKLLTLSRHVICYGMAHFKDLSDQTFGNLTVMRWHGRKPTRWECRCACGTILNVRSQALIDGHTKSCGCLKLERVAAMGKSNRTHGHASERTPTYVTWVAMIARCTNQNLAEYQRYGGEGITVSERWRHFPNFLADMGNRPHGKTIDRWPNNAGNYEPGNCRWATRLEQTQNRARVPRRNSATGQYLSGRGVPV